MTAWLKTCPHCGGRLGFIGPFYRSLKMLHCDDCACNFYCLKRGLIASQYNRCRKKA